MVVLNRHAVFQLLLPFASVGAALATTVLVPTFVERGAMVLLMAAVVIVNLIVGWRAGAMTAALATLAVAWVLPPSHTFAIDAWPDVLRFFLFIALALLITGLHVVLEHTRSALAASERRLTVSLEAVKMAAWDYDLNTGTFWRSAAFDRIFGGATESDPSSYETFLGHIHPDDQAAVQTAIERAIATAPSDFDVEHRIIQPDGEVRRLLTRGRACVDDRGKTSKIVAVAVDVTERHEPAVSVASTPAFSAPKREPSVC